MQAVTVSAPGSLMICGEHAVVQGYGALVCAVDVRVTVRLRRLDAPVLEIASALGSYRAPLNALHDDSRLKFVLAAVRESLPDSGVAIEIDSAIDPTMGLGSSAAVTATVTAGLLALADVEVTPEAVHRPAHRAVLAVQGRGSGADLAASIAGGLVYYQREPLTIRAMALPPAVLSLRYAGYKTPTGEVLALLAEKSAAAPVKYQALYRGMGEVTEQAARVAEADDWPAFYQALNDYQGLMAELGVCDAVQAGHIQEARRTALAAKISGSGLGDCIIAYADGVPAGHSAVVPAAGGIIVQPD